MIALIDCDAFYCSCHTVFEPKLIGKPVAVASNNDGCLVSRNAQVKALGIKMGAPVFQIQPEIKRYGIKVFSSSFYLYGDMSRRVMQVLAQFSPAIEIYSIDEAFLDVSGIPLDLTDYGQSIVQTVKQWTGIPVSIGIAPTKVLSKVCARLVKQKLAGSGGVCVWNNLENPNQHLAQLPVTDLWGISARLGKRLDSIGIITALQLKHSNPKLMRSQFSVCMERIVRELNGEPCIALEQAPPPKQQILVSRSFGTKLTLLQDLRAAVSAFATRAGEKLRQQGLNAQALCVFIQTSPFDESTQYYSNAATIVFDQPCQDSRRFSQAAAQGLCKIYRPGFKYLKAGVMLLNLLPETVNQLSVFDSLEERSTMNNAGLMSVMDDINRRFGRDSIRLAGSQLSAAWHMRQTMLSPAYTTRWDEIPVVKCFS